MTIEARSGISSDRVLSSAVATLALGARAERECIEFCAPVCRIVTVHSGSLRELLFSLPALRALRETFEGAHLSSVVREGLAPLLRACPVVDDVLARPKGGLSSHAHLMAKLHAHHCDMAIAFSTSRNGVLLALASGANVRLGFDGAKMDALLTHRVAREMAPDQRSIVFAIEDYLDLTRALGCAPRCHDYCDLLRPAIEDEQEVASWLRERKIESEFILLCSQRETKIKREAREAETELKRWMQTALLLAQRAPVVICGERPHRTLMSAAREYSTADATKVFDAGGAFDLPALAAISGRARLFVGWSSGASHLSAAMSTPVVALREGTENYSADEPRGVPHRLLKSDATPEHVAQSARELIGL